MEKILIKDKKLVKIGDSWGIIVDMAYIRNGLVSTEKKYTVVLREEAGSDDK